MSLYELRGVRRLYPGAVAVEAVAGVNLDIDAGEFVAVEGPSGSGKTTLLQLLGALERPTEGSVVYDGQDISRLSSRALTRLRLHDLGFVFQSFNLIPTLTAVENVELPLAAAGVANPSRRQRAEALLEQVGLASRRHHLPSRLSGGEQQRVAIGRALANGPRVLLADEPTGNLDSETAAEVVALLGALCRDQQLTVLLVTHAESVARHASRRIAMSDGRIVGDTGVAAPGAEPPVGLPSARRPTARLRVRRSPSH